MRSIMLSLTTRTICFLSRLADTLRQQQAGWFTNRSGHSSFSAEVVPADGGFSAVISRRTGYCSRDFCYQKLTSTPCFRSARRARREGRNIARQMATLRYRFD